MCKEGTEAQDSMDKSLTEISIAAIHSCKSIHQYSMSEQQIDACTSRDGASGILQAFQLCTWRDKSGKKGMCKTFKKELHQFSVSARRNASELITVDKEGQISEERSTPGDDFEEGKVIDSAEDHSSIGINLMRAGNLASCQQLQEEGQGDGSKGTASPDDSQPVQHIHFNIQDKEGQISEEKSTSGDGFEKGKVIDLAEDPSSIGINLMRAGSLASSQQLQEEGQGDGSKGTASPDDSQPVQHIHFNVQGKKGRTSPAVAESATDPPYHADNGSIIQEVDPHVCRRYVHHSTYFHAAEKIAYVPFLDHHVLECDFNGLEYTNVDHDITLRIPEGAVAKGEKVHFEVGVAMYGPFIFSENTQPISPILWLCIIEEDIQLKKPFQVVLPHYLTGLSKERIQHHQVQFSKAKHCNSTIVDDQITYKFQHCDAKPHFATSGYRSYGVLISKHCCFYCLEARVTPELAIDAGYCLVRIESSSLQRNEVVFTAVYFLDTCLKSLEEQFSRERGYNIAQYTTFKFREDKEPSIQIVVPKQDDRYTIGFEPAKAKITASGIAFWDKKKPLMKRQHVRKVYPPRVKMTVGIKDSTLTPFVLPVKFVGCRDDELDTDLTLPLGRVDALALSFTCRSASVGPQNSEPHSKHIICGEQDLKDIFKRLHPLATSWDTIGTLLGVHGHVLDRIKSERGRVDECLRVMLSEWLKLINPPPTWTALAGAVEVIDESTAQSLKEMH